MPRYDDFSETSPGLFTFTGAGSPTVTLTGPVAAEEAARIAAQRPAAAPLALTGMSSAPPMASGLPEERSDAVPSYAPTMGANGMPRASFASSSPVDTLDNPLNAPPEPVASMAPKEELVSRKPEASFAGDRSVPAPTRRIGPGGQGGGASGPARVDASGGFLDAYNAEAVRQLTQRGGGSSGTKADAWQNQTRQTQVQDDRVGAIPMAGYLGAVGSEGSANERVRQEGDAIDAQKLAKEAEAEQQAAAAIAQAQREAQLKRQDLRASMEAITNEAAEPDVDPGKWWGERSTASAILLGLAAGAAGMTNGRAGIAGNPVIAGIEKAVERDIESQVRSKDTKERGKAAKLQRLGQLYNMVKEETGDDVQAMNQAKLTALTVAQKQLQAKALEADSPLATARADAAYAALDRRKAEIVIENEKHLQVQKTGTERFVPRGTGAGGGPNRLKLLHDAAMTNKEFNPHGKPGEAGRGTAAYGDVRFELDPRLGDAEAATVRRVGVAIDQGMKAVDDVIQRRGTGVSTLDADVLHGIDRMAYSDALITGQGQATKDQVDGAREKWRGIVAEKGLKYARETFENDANLYKKQYERR